MTEDTIQILVFSKNIGEIEYDLANLGCRALPVTKITTAKLFL